jgi:hypothetical protein
MAVNRVARTCHAATARAEGEAQYGVQAGDHQRAAANSPIAVFGHTVLVPAGAPVTSSSGRRGTPQLEAYTLR